MVFVVLFFWSLRSMANGSALKSQRKSDSVIHLSVFAKVISGWRKTKGCSKNTALTSSRSFSVAGNWRSKHWPAAILRLMSIGQVVQAGLAGFDLALIAGVEIYYDSTVFAQPGITRLEQLKGKRIGISGYGAATHFAAIILAQHLKLDPDKDLILVPGGPDAERIAAMSAGKIDAGVFNSSTLPIAKRMGLVELVRIPDLKVEVQGNGMATTRTYIKSNRDVVKSALKGYIEGINFIFNNKQAAQKVFGKYMRTNDAEVLETSYQAYINTTPRKPYPTLKGLQFLLGPPRADDAAGEDGQAGTVCRHEFSAGTGEGRLFQRDGETLSGEIESRNIDHKGHKGHRVEDLDANISPRRHEGHEGLENLNSETSCSSYYYS